MIELRNADTLRFGDSEPYVFEMPPIQPSPTQKRKNRPAHAKCMETGREDRFILPLVGNKIKPKEHRERFTRQPINHKRLCSINGMTQLPKDKVIKDMNGNEVQRLRRSASASRVTHISLKGPAMKLDNMATATKGPTPPSSDRSSLGGNEGGHVWTRLSIASEGPNSDPSRHVGNQLLQRVVRLQAELQRRDEEITRLRENATMPSTTGDRVQHVLDEYREALARAQVENEKLRGALNGNSQAIIEIGADSPKAAAYTEKLKEVENQLYLTELIYNTFFNVCCHQLDDFNRKVSTTAMRDYSDVFGETVRALQEPFSFRLMEINSKCSSMFERQKLDPSERDMLYEQFDHFLKGKIYPISKAFDTFMPILKDAATMARESIRACTVFSQWSREFGDQLQLQPNWEHMAYKAEDLQARFKEYSMPKHWLPPSIIPILKILIYEHKNRLEDQERKEAEYVMNVKNQAMRIVDLEKMLEAHLSQLHQTENEKREIAAKLAQANDEQESLRRENGSLKGRLQELEDYIRKVDSARDQVLLRKHNGNEA
ncbi:Protein Y53G8AL.1 [Aphelenchoides avenae]|nr:Protein Y53G8AL.1 [Aphelenchus avenae]